MSSGDDAFAKVGQKLMIKVVNAGGRLRRHGRHGLVQQELNLPLADQFLTLS